MISSDLSTIAPHRVFNGPRTEIGLTRDNDNISCSIKLRFLDDRQYACVYREWKSSSPDPYFEKNFVGNFVNGEVIRMIGLGNMISFGGSDAFLLDVDFRNEFIQTYYPYVLKEVNDIHELWDNIIK